MSYASKTTVTVDRSQAQIRKLLSKYKAQAMAIAESEKMAQLKFIYEGKPYKLCIFYPDRNSVDVTRTNSGKLRTAQQIDKYMEEEEKRLWRCMLLFLKAAIEAHENGFMDLKKSLLSSMELPNGQTIYEQVSSDLNKFEANPKLLM